MRLPITLSLYIGRQCLTSMSVAMGGVIGVIGLIELVELIRRASKRAEDIPFHTIIEMTLLKLPITAEKVLPFAVLIGAMVAMARLTRSSELVAARASGVSVWQFLAPVIALGMLVGVLFTTVFNPVAASMATRYESMEEKYIVGSSTLFTVSASGLWLRQVEDINSTINDKKIESYIIHARTIVQSDYTLKTVVIHLYGAEDEYLGRIDAPTAQLKSGYWDIPSGSIAVPGLSMRSIQDYRLDTLLNIRKIQDSFAAPQTLSFWDLPNFIQTLESAGFSALRHKLHWHSLLSAPLLLTGMICIAAVFSLRQPRRGKVAMLIVAGVMAGFIVFFTTNLVYALGYSGSLPIFIAAWTPPLITIMLGVSALLHIEDG